MAEPSISNAHYPKIRDRKQKVRLWFEFYKLACLDETLRDEIEKSRAFYEPWGDVTETLFDPWWVEHKHLFPPTQVEVLKAKSITTYPGTLSVHIPLSLPRSQAMSQIRALLKKMDENECDKTAFCFSSARFDGSLINEVLELYRYYLKTGKPKLGKDFVDGYIAHLTGRKRSRWLPKSLVDLYLTDVKQGAKSYQKDRLRTVSRCVKYADRLILSAAQGKFPPKLN